jgi:HD-GYP domain-containing protein (c-di-GMP phosphodiesterase class II)
MQAEHQVGLARARHPSRMKKRERSVLACSAVAFTVVAVAIAIVVDTERPNEPLLTLALLGGYALVSRVRFEFGNGYVVPEQLVFVPMLYLSPLEYVPLLAAAAGLLAMVPDFLERSWHRDRWLGPLADSWFAIGPVLVLAAFAAPEPRLDGAPIYVLAFTAQIGGDLLWSLLRDKLIDGLPSRDSVMNWLGVVRVDAVLSPIAFVVTLVAMDHPAALLVLGPLVWLLAIFSHERQERYAAALELHRAYRGTVMLLSDVVEFDDPYTAAHSRSIVDLVHAVADDMGIEEDRRQELEFAALLHDVGKITIPKEILNKPAALTSTEFEVMKSHTIEGQFMLDRVGGLLARVGEIIRSCHERWDGTGYPDGLRGEQIPFESRLVFACDAYNAMTTDRVYRRSLTQEQAVAELLAGSGSQFDPRIVDTLVRVVRELEPRVDAADEVRALLAGGPVASHAGATTR